MIYYTRFLGCFILLSAGSPASSQYYYKDIVTSQIAAKERQVLEEQDVRKIIVHSFEADKTPSPGFFCEKVLAKDHRKHTSYIRSEQAGKSLQIVQFNKEGQLISNSDSSENTAYRSTYVYDDQQRLTAVHSYNRASDEDFNDLITESHLYSYEKTNLPVRMWRVRNGKDSTEIKFLHDEQGRITDEIELKPGGLHYYYYYDSRGRLSDIVKYHVVRQRLLADYMFEYNSAGQITQMTTVDDGATNQYWVWKYTYNNGVKIIEKCFDRGKTLVGYVEYEYE